MRPYLDLMRHVRDHGARRDDRTGVGTLGVFGWQLRFDLSQGLPGVTTKKLYWPAVIHELLWFLRGETNVKPLQAVGVKIWDAWADPDTGDLGPIYGKQWRAWPTPDGSTRDQLAAIIAEIRRAPDSRRLLVSAWNVADLDRMALQPCHVMFQLYVCDGRLSCQVYQRSADIFLGLPFNIASYAILTHLIAQVCGLGVGDLVHTLGDAHIYLNHLTQVDEQLRREPLPLATLRLNPSVRTIDGFSFEDVVVEGYQSHGVLRAPVAV
jgi:thymidylate synthase